jgi:hypothetical protein
MEERTIESLKKSGWKSLRVFENDGADVLGKEEKRVLYSHQTKTVILDYKSDEKLDS